MPISIASPEAAVAATPYLLGFTPRDSLVLLLLDDRLLQVAVRVDIPPCADPSWLSSVLQGMPDDVPPQVLLIAFADEAPGVWATAVAGWLCDVLAPLTEVVGLVVVADGRVRSMLEGPGAERFDDSEDGCSVAALQDHPVVAECVAAGLSHLPDREALRSMLEAVRDDVAESVCGLLDGVSPGDEAGHAQALETWAVQILSSADRLTAEAVARVARACNDWRARDPMFAELLDRAYHGEVSLSAVRTRLTYCLTRTPASHVGGVAASLALLSWSDGDGAAAMCAAEHAASADPTNTLAPLVMAALERGLPPQTWAEVTCDIPRDVLRGRSRRSA